MSTLHATVLTALKQKGWAYHEVKDFEVVELKFEAYHGKVELHVQSFSEAHLIAVVANASSVVPRTHRMRTAELLMRANKELNLGNFEMDWDSGLVMYRQSNMFPKHRYDSNLIVGLIQNAVAEMDRMTPLLGELLNSSKEMLPFLGIPDLLKREDLLPPVPEPEEDAS